MSAPVVTVLMPVYNAGRYVAEAVESVLAQTFGDFEFLIIDDGSTDRSRVLLERFAARDDRIRLFSRPNKGLVATLNEGLGLARGELIARMDADDVAMPERLALQVDFLRAHPEVVCLGGCHEEIDRKGRFLVKFPCPEDDGEIQDLLLSGRNAFVHPSVMMRRGAVEAIGRYDPAMAQSEDLDLFLRLGERGRLACLPRVILRYRMHGGSKTELYLEEQSSFAKSACDRACLRRGIEPRYRPLGAFRRGLDRASKHQHSLKYGWWAFGDGRRPMALRCGLESVWWAPWRLDGWRLLACALLKPVGHHA